MEGDGPPLLLALRRQLLELTGRTSESADSVRAMAARCNDSFDARGGESRSSSCTVRRRNRGGNPMRFQLSPRSKNAPNEYDEPDTEQDENDTEIAALRPVRSGHEFVVLTAKVSHISAGVFLECSRGLPDVQLPVVPRHEDPAVRLESELVRAVQKSQAMPSDDAVLRF